MSDEADLAQAHEERDRDRNIARALAGPAEPRRSAGDGFCESCGDAIEGERLAVQPGALRCFCCQEARERFQKLFGG